MRSETPKHLHPLLGRRMVDWVIDAARALSPDRLVVVTSPETQDAIAGDGITVAVQPEARGTGDAVAAAHPALDGFDGDILVLSGDSPLLTPELLEGLVESHRAGEAAAGQLRFFSGDLRALNSLRISRGDRNCVTSVHVTHIDIL